MRIAMVGQKGIPALYGGVERHVEELSLELAKQGHEVLVYARAWYTPKTIKNYYGVKVIHTPTIHTKHLDAIVHTFTSTCHALAQKMDVIHYHGVGPTLLAFMPRLFSPKTKVISTFHCIDRYHQKWNWLAKKILALGERAACYFPHDTISVSKTIQNYCINEYGKQTHYIPNGANGEQLIKGGVALEKWGIELEKYFMMVARLVKHKGVHYLLEAWQYARSQYPQLFKDYKLLIVGDGVFTDKYVKELKRIARGDSSIVFTGWVNGQPLTDLFLNCKILIHPSENEGMSLAVLRAMACGKPVLVSDIPEQQELITDTRFQFTNTSISSLANKLIELMKNEQWLKEAGEANKKLALQKFNWHEIAKETVKVYSTHKLAPVAKMAAQN